MIVKVKDASCKPNDIKQSSWIIKDQEYTVARLLRSKITGEQFFDLNEVKPDFPYGGYLCKRFCFKEEDLLKFINEKNVVFEF